MNKVVVLGDFAENYQHLIQDEIQSFHCSKEYCTLHPLVIYYKDVDGNLQHYSLCFISDDNTHSTSFVHKIQALLVEFLKQRLPNITRSVTFLMVVVGNIKISRTSLIYVPIKRAFPSKQSGFSFQLATGNHHVMELVLRWSLQRPLNSQVLDYCAVLKVWQEEMKSIIFFGIDKEEMFEVREKMETRFEDGNEWMNEWMNE